MSAAGSNATRRPVPTWGPPASTAMHPESSADAIFRVRVRPALPANGPMETFHDDIQTSNHVSQSLVTQYLNELSSVAATGNAWKAWASINVACQAAVSKSHFGVIQALLDIPCWQVCKQSRALNAATNSDDYTELLWLLISDARFRERSLLLRISRDLIGRIHFTHRDGTVSKVLRVLLSIPHFAPVVLWDAALTTTKEVAFRPDSHVFALPSFFQFDELMDGAEWQIDRVRNQRDLADCDEEQLDTPWPPHRFLSPPDHPSLLLDLPHDIQLSLHDLLDLKSIHALRLTCRALRHFPVDRLIRRRVENTLLYLFINNSITYDSAYVQRLIESVPNQAGPSLIDYRTLVEAIRHLDAELALKFLCPHEQDITNGYNLCDAPHSEPNSYVVSWALFVLLKQLSKDRQQENGVKGGILLEALLMHPMLNVDAWSLVLFYFDVSHATLVAAALATDSVISTLRSRIATHRASNPTVATAQCLVQLIRTGKLPDPIPTSILLELQSLPAPSYHEMSSSTRAFLLFATLSYNPPTFASLTALLPSPPPDPITNILLAILCHRPDPKHYVSHVVARLGPIPESKLRTSVAARAKRAANRDVLGQILPRLAPKDVYTLLFPMSATAKGPETVKVNALVLTHWLKLVAAGAPGTRERMRVGWKEVSRLTELLRVALHELGEGGDQVAGERLRELVEVCEPVRDEWEQRMPVNVGWGESCLIQ